MVDDAEKREWEELPFFLPLSSCFALDALTLWSLFGIYIYIYMGGAVLNPRIGWIWTQLFLKG